MEKKFFVFVIALSVLCTLIAKPQDDLFTACLQGDLAGVKEAVESGADVKALNPASGQNALAHAFFYPEITRYLLEKGCDPNGGNYPALVSASSVASLDVMKLLLENGADPNLPGINESALLKVVQMTNCPDAAELLLSKGADIKTTTSNYANLLGVYASYGLPQIERKAAMTAYGNILKGYGLTVPEWYFNPSENLNEPPIEMVNVLVAAGLDINKRGTNLYDKKKSGEPPIFIAMNVGHQEIMLSLLEYGADYNETYLPILPELPLFAIEGELTPLMYACIKGYKVLLNGFFSSLT
ncbi:MAG: ankyrin repeat domain-containing protein [Candidatus Cloacimonetes bacterium]|nr:ankyrin repeat domain-containing protein [Candidatus Cloacimonadota bacterium]